MPTPEKCYLKNHRAHDVHALMRRWKSISTEAGLVPVRLGKQEGFVVTAFRPRIKYPDGSPWIYLSAGVHGDEPAAPLGLIEWAEENTELLAKYPFLIIPCFCPWSIANNSRNGPDGEDPNRNFNHPAFGYMRTWQDFVARKNLRLAISLHEDYDANGTYVYELSNRNEFRAEVYLKAAERAIPPEPCNSIEGMRSKNGVIRRKRKAPDMPGLPETLYLHQKGAEVAMTFETPSEYSLYHRANAHRLFISAAVKYIVKNP